MNEITSINNELIKSVAKLSQKKYRDESGLFIIEGEKGVEEAIASGLKLKDIFINKTNEKLIKKYEKYQITLVNEKILEKITDAKTAPDIAATAEKLENKINLLPSQNSAVLLLENIKDAGNLGTAIRTAAAFNMDGIILLGDTVDLYSPKVVRSSVGYLWKTPIYKTNDFSEVRRYFKNHKFYATSVDKSLPLKPLKNADIKQPCVIMFGSEAFGLSKEAVEKSDVYVTIPIKGDIESLNLSISIGIVLYEFKR
ncbi:MAG: RNA methyltransferase [bacterium]|nr:RNA methyltransferase [bacterium]